MTQIGIEHVNTRHLNMFIRNNIQFQTTKWHGNRDARKEIRDARSRITIYNYRRKKTIIRGKEREIAKRYRSLIEYCRLEAAVGDYAELRMGGTGSRDARKDERTKL